MDAVEIQSYKVVVFDKADELFFPEARVRFARECEAATHAVDLIKKFKKVVGRTAVVGTADEVTHVYIEDFGAVALNGVYHMRRLRATGDALFVVRIPEEPRISVVLMQDLELPPGEGQVLCFGEPAVRIATADGGRHLSAYEAGHLSEMLEYALDLLVNILAPRTGRRPDEVEDLT